MSWDFDSFNESGFDGFIDSGFDARGGSKAVLWKIDPENGSTIWSADWTEIASFTSPIVLLAVTQAHVIAVYLSANSLTMFIKTLTLDGLPVDAYTLTSSTAFSRNVMLHVPTGHLMWVASSKLYRFDPIAKTYALNGVAVTPPFGLRNVTSTSSGDIVWTNAQTNGFPDANRLVVSGQTGASSQIAAGGNIAERSWRSNSQASTGLASTAVNTANAEDGVATHAGYNVSGFATMDDVMTLSGQIAAPCVGGASTYGMAYGPQAILRNVYVRKIGGWTIQPFQAGYSDTFPGCMAASTDTVFVGTGGSVSRLDAFAADDGGDVWSKTFNETLNAPFQMTVGTDDALYVATNRAS